MSLRRWAFLLLVVNAAYFVYAQGWLSGVLGSTASQREPERIKRQINTDAVTIEPVASQNTRIEPPSTPESSGAASVPLSAPVPPSIATKTDCTNIAQERWVVYMGPYATTALRDSKLAELKQRQVSAELISKPSLKIGLSLGEYDSEAAARQAIKTFATKGVRTATVVLWPSASSC
jgi:malonyl CoA-acyl carrier protein transacylase